MPEVKVVCWLISWHTCSCFWQWMDNKWAVSAVGPNVCEKLAKRWHASSSDTPWWTWKPCILPELFCNWWRRIIYILSASQHIGYSHCQLIKHFSRAAIMAGRHLLVLSRDRIQGSDQLGSNFLTSLYRLGQRPQVSKLLSLVSERLECFLLTRMVFQSMHVSPAKLQINFISSR